MASLKPKHAKKKRTLSGVLFVLCNALIGAVCGFVAAKSMHLPKGAPLGQTLMRFGAALLGLYTVVFVQTVLHEAGHLLAGLASGYAFSSFRVGSLMIVRERGALKLRRLTLAGTGGQCLMLPSENSPFVLYHLGGVLMNLASAALCGALYTVCKGPILSPFLLLMALVGAAVALLNGVPLRLSAMRNDGGNLLELCRSPQARRAVHVQMRVTEQLSRGVRLRDMPDAWFALPDECDMRSSLVSALAVFAASRLMDELRFADASALMDDLLRDETRFAGVHLNSLRCDRLFCELLGSQDVSVIAALDTEDYRAFARRMKRHPSVLRTAYARALLLERDEKKAAQCLAQFERCAKSHPYAADIESERDLIAAANRAAQR